MTQQELIQYIGNEGLANRLIKILGNPDLAKMAYDELEESKRIDKDPSQEVLHDYSGVVDPPEWMFLYKGYVIDFKDGKVYVDKELIPITFTEYIPFESIIRATLEYIDKKELKTDLDVIKENLHDAPDNIKEDFNSLVMNFNKLI